MQDYITQTLQIINPDSPTILAKSNTYYQNRVIDKATALWEENPANYPILYDWFVKSHISDQASADHHGKPIGTFLRYTTSPKDSRYYTKVAQFKKLCRALVRSLDIHKEIDSLYYVAEKIPKNLFLEETLPELLKMIDEKK